MNSKKRKDYEKFIQNNSNLFWNLKKDSKVDKVTFVEHIFKYGDFGDIVELFRIMDKQEIKKIWLNTMAWDERFLKINLMIARVFFDMDVETDYFMRLSGGRFKNRLFIK